MIQITWLAKQRRWRLQQQSRRQPWRRQQQEQQRRKRQERLQRQQEQLQKRLVLEQALEQPRELVLVRERVLLSYRKQRGQQRRSGRPERRSSSFQFS